MLTYTFCGEIECLAIEINIWKKQYLLYGTYNPHKSMTSNHLCSLSKSIDHCMSHYDTYNPHKSMTSNHLCSLSKSIDHCMSLYDTYNPHKSMISNHLCSLSKSIDHCMSLYDTYNPHKSMVSNHLCSLSKSIDHFMSLYDTYNPHKSMVSNHLCYLSKSIDHCMSLYDTYNPHKSMVSNHLCSLSKSIDHCMSHYDTYNPHKSMISNHLCSLSKSIDHFMSHYDTYNPHKSMEMSEDKMREFCEIYNLKNLVKDPTCYKNPLNPSCIDLIITNQPNFFQNTKVIETGLSDFHKLSVSVLMTIFKKQPPKIISYREYRNYSPARFSSELLNLLSVYGIPDISNDDFVNIFMFLLNIHAPIKHKYIRANNNPFVMKELRKAIMRRSKLRNRYNKLKTMEANVAYKRQRNMCTSLLKKAKRIYYGSLNPISCH